MTQCGRWCEWRLLVEHCCTGARAHAMLHGGRVHMRAVEGPQTSHLDVVPAARPARRWVPVPRSKRAYCHGVRLDGLRSIVMVKLSKVL